MLNHGQATPARILRRAAILGPLLLALLPVTPAQAEIKGGGFVWVNRLTFVGTPPGTEAVTLSKYEFTGAHVTSLHPGDLTIAEFGRGMAVDGEGDLWYSALIKSGTALVGDGRIHTLIGGLHVTFADPGGFAGIGALDFADGSIWAISYFGSPNYLYRIDPTTGAVEASCSVPGSTLTDTLAVRGTTFLTDGGGVSSTTLTAYEIPTTEGATCATTGESFTLPFGVRGIDHVHGSRLLASDGSSVHDLSRRPYTASVGSIPVPEGWDISVVFK